jgi:hypothetical protein
VRAGKLEIAVRAVALAGTAAFLAGCTDAANDPLPSTEVEGEATGAAAPTTDAQVGGSDVTLLLQEEDARGWHEANVTGTIGVNEQGCVVVDGALLIAPFGSTTRGSLATDDVVIELVGFPPMPLGETLTAAGATYHEPQTAAEDAVPQIAECIDPDADTINYSVIAPGQA